MTLVVSEEKKAAFILDANGAVMPNVENFYKFCAERKLVGVKCKCCWTVISPPRLLCPKCFTSSLEWTELKGQGKLLTFTVIHFPPGQFQALSPYAVGIAKMDEGPHLPGMIKNVKLEDLKIGMRLQVDFETALPKDWPRWPRYFFKPIP
jgi:uncharacterized OB-fold protein